MAEQPVIVVAGPTASGKSGLAMDLAERLEGTIINADSMKIASRIFCTGSVTQPKRAPLRTGRPSRMARFNPS